MKDRRGNLRRRAVGGPEAPLHATERALQRAGSARALVLVEGISDQVAVEVAAHRMGRDLAAEGVVVVPAGGVGSIGALALRFGPAGAGLPLVGLCDAAEVVWVCRALVKARVGIALDVAGLARLGFFVCARDLEDELIRALEPGTVEALLDREGDLTAFRTLQRQKVWADAPFADQVRRFLAAGAGRKLRYAGVFTGAVALGQMPAPLGGLMDRVSLKTGNVT